MPAYVAFDEKVSQLAGGGAPGMEVKPGTIHAALLQVARAYPGLHAFNCDGELRSVLKVTKNGQPVAVTEELKDGETVRLAVG